jgi:hypothetical protein
MQTRTALLVTAMTMTLTACASAPEAVGAKTLVLEDFFNGRSHARGTFVNSFTGAVRGLTVVIDGSFDGKVLTLVEDFAYDDGEKDKKTWQLTRTGPRTYTGTREDVIGEAKAYPDGDNMRLEYMVALKTEAYGDIHVRFRDVLALEPGGTLINRATVSKWGLRLGRVELRMTPEAK